VSTVCASRQINRDLKPWLETGISEDLIDNSSELSDVSHYQVIGHKLYRSEETDFPARYSLLGKLFMVFLN
jgi:Glycosyl transferase family 90